MISPFKSQFRQRRGFSMAELVIVTAIGGLMMLVIINMFVSQSRRANEMFSLRDRQQVARTLFSHLLVDIKGALTIKSWGTDHLELVYFKDSRIPAALNYTNNLIDGGTTRTWTITYQRGDDNQIVRKLDDQIQGRYPAITALKFEGLGLDPTSNRTDPVPVTDPSNAVGLYICIEAAADEEDNFPLTIKSKIFSQAQWSLKIYGVNPSGRPFYPDRGGFFSSIDRFRGF